MQTDGQTKRFSDLSSLAWTLNPLYTLSLSYVCKLKECMYAAPSPNHQLSPHTHHCWILVQVTVKFSPSILFKKYIYTRLVVRLSCQIHVPMQLCRSPTTRRSSWGSSPTAPTCSTRRVVTKRGSASWTSCWLIPMKSALQRGSTMWVWRGNSSEQHLALDDKALYPQIL